MVNWRLLDPDPILISKISGITLFASSSCSFLGYLGRGRGRWGTWQARPGWDLTQSISGLELESPLWGHDMSDDGVAVCL